MPTSGGRRRAAKRFANPSGRPKRNPFPLIQPSRTPPGVHRYRLVQRLQKPQGTCKCSDGSAFNGLFDPEYMGSVEFEYEAVPDTLKSIRDSREVVIRSCEIQYEDRTRMVYFVGTRAGLEDKVADFQTWLKKPLHERSKERTDFELMFTGMFPSYKDPKSRKRPHWLRTIAWLSLTDEVAWALNPRTARRLQRAFA